ncbi:hypothetical protein CGZ97_07500 [Enemella evansiae]|nr:hypothetical protein CGZ97_07500 [Enemella evansiae]
MSMLDRADVALEDVLSKLRDENLSMTVADLLSTGGSELRVPGLYSWWADVAGAAELSRGLGLDSAIRPGLVYAGLAGGSHKVGPASKNTLWIRITRMHLGPRSRSSTLRRSLGSVLAEAQGQSAIDEVQLTEWMHKHLRVITVPIAEVQSLDNLETEVLQALDPPLNLAKVPRTGVRRRLKMLRARYAHSGSQ